MRVVLGLLIVLLAATGMWAPAAAQDAPDPGGDGGEEIIFNFAEASLAQQSDDKDCCLGGFLNS